MNLLTIKKQKIVIFAFLGRYENKGRVKKDKWNLPLGGGAVMPYFQLKNNNNKTWALNTGFCLIISCFGWWDPYELGSLY